MSAQYRPYRDEESVDGLEAATWTDNEPGTIQIYEKTTEELPFGSVNKRTLWFQIALLISVGFLGFLLGYFTPYHSAVSSSSMESILGETDSELLEHFEAYYAHEDTTIKDKILAQINASNILSTLITYQDTNRIPGSESNHKFAQHVQDKFTEFEFDRVTAINYTFGAMLPSKASIVKLMNKENKTLYSNIEFEKYNHDDMRPFLPLSQANETIISTNQILYVNRGLKEDYANLSSLGIGPTEAEGKVLVIRQSFYQSYEVVINAQENGAKALLLFPDPDLYGESSPFPKSVRLPNDAGRSHPSAWSNYGDLALLNLTAMSGIELTKLGLERESKVHIPVIPISFDTAKRILRGLSGPPAPNNWNCFDFTLYIGPGYREENNEEKRDHIEIEFYNQETTITTTTVTGTITGSTEPDRYVVIGSRRDSLNRGLLDSVSGSAVMLEIARVYGSLLKQGWRPRRTIIFNSFGAESLNLIASSNWLDLHQRLLHSRAVAYLNCDLVVTGNRSAAIAASPLLFQVLFNSTKQVDNPNIDENPNQKTTYDAWMSAHQFSKSDEIDAHKLTDPELEKLLEEYDTGELKLTKSAMESNSSYDESREDGFGLPGTILHEFKKSATTKTRPEVRRLDLQSIYSPFLIYAGIPVVDVRYSGFLNHENNDNNKSRLLEDMIPLIGTKYDNLATVKNIDPHLKYHVAVTKILSEILRDLSDSAFLPFNLIDYAVTLKNSYTHLVAKYKNVFEKYKLDLDPLKESIGDFIRTAIKFHHRQDGVNLKDALKVRKFNDQLMLLERAFLDPNGTPTILERKHLILTPNDGQDHKEGFPGLVDLITLSGSEILDPDDTSLFVEILKVHYKAVVITISNAIKIIDEVHIL